ncbi:papilin-like [Dermacentor andersoni]|uniref:papilin-like n=1 Tax=Dermacentor andersoni TaxID=34620 RepID=UPI003B3B612F
MRTSVTSDQVEFKPSGGAVLLTAFLLLLDSPADGRRHPVGCDKMLGSDAVEDKCRVCRGDGTSCSTVKGVFNLDNLQFGYNDILLIPSGATNIRIEEKFPTNNYLAVRNQTGYYYLNGNWRIEFPRSIRFAGTVFHYKRRNHGANAAKSLVALGPTLETIVIVLLYQEKNLGITYEYSVPHGDSQRQPDMYNWNSGDFGECSETCGGGAQTRLVYCTSAITFEKVSDDLCNPTVKPQATRVCNPEPCPATWYVGEWEDCSKSCGNGTQERLVFCQRHTKVGSLLTADSDCKSSGPRPERLQDCSSYAKCASWKAGNWTECDRLCGEGTQIREVVCVNSLGAETVEVLDDSGCGESTKPPSNQTCRHLLRLSTTMPQEDPPGASSVTVSAPPAVPSWTISTRQRNPTMFAGLRTDDVDDCLDNNDHCEVPRSSRIATRQVLCTNKEGILFPDEYCDDEKRPNTTKPCDEDDSALDEQYQYMWYYTQWSPCSTECGNGMQTRKVICGIFNDGSIIDVTDDNCNPAEQLNSTRECTVEAVCNDTWVAAPWNQCSTPCGGGQRTRTIICHVNGKPAAPKNCDVSKKPFDTESCNRNACDEDEVILLGGCKDSKHGCCPAGMTLAGPSFTGCPEVTPVEGGCKATEFGCCLDGVTAAFGPFRKGCQQLSLCNGTEFGCCHDGKTPAEGPNNEGCLMVTTDAALFVNCSTAEWGCCPDGITAAEDVNKTNCIEVMATKVIPCADSQFGCCPNNMTAADGPGGLTCFKGSRTEEPCHGTTHGCCPDGWSVAQGPNNEGCPPYFQVTPVANCSLSTHGCCADGMTAAAGPDGLGCEDEVEGSGTEPTDCENTLFGCCQDGRTPASGAGFEGCSDCSNNTFGCCPDGVSTATGEAFEGCAEGCEATKYGCCQDKISPAEGPDFEGCENCTESLYGCCEDNVTFALGPDGEGCCVATEFGCCHDNVTAATADGCICNITAHGCCPDNVTVALGPKYVCHYLRARQPHCRGLGIIIVNTWACSFSIIINHSAVKHITIASVPSDALIFEGCACELLVFGCCPDKKSPAEGPDFEGCVICTNTTFGCCPDDVTAALGPNFEGCEGYETNCTNTPFGCCPDGLAPAWGIGFEGCDNCSESLYGCCADNTSFALGPDGEGCCFHTEFGCCLDNKTEAQGPDRHTPAGGPNFEGCICSRLLYRCCPDDVTPAEGPDMASCPCQITEFGCCLDKRTPARGPNLAGCGCDTMPYGCCPDQGCFGPLPVVGTQRTPARVPGFGGCPCTAMPYGCCPDQHTAATGPDGRGCECEKLLYGCCPDDLTPATGPSLTGCTCHHYPYGCCPDGQTPARGPEYDGCTCAMTAYGCCPDGVTAARGRNFEGCQGVCGLPEESGPCHNYTVYWFFNVTDGRCNRFWYGGCEGNGNRFNSEEECKNTCVKPEGADACLLTMVIGTCDGQYQHWHFDATTRSCESFMYGGCLGNNNRFASEDLFSHIQPCEQSAAPGPCRGSYKRFYYDRQDNQCKRFTYGGCQGNANNFATEEECSERCVRLSAQGSNICLLPQEAGNCTELRERWFYNAQEGRCHRFYYGGCDGNENNFASHLECEQACGQPAPTKEPEEVFRQGKGVMCGSIQTMKIRGRNFCFMPTEAGPCTNMEVRWFYDKQDGVCREFHYGGCLGNRNRFRSGRDCEERCFSSQDLCLLPRVQGPCSGTFTQWFYDPETDRCHEFTYGGCQGNANSFNDREACENQCRKGVPVPTEPPIERPTPVEVVTVDVVIATSENRVGAPLQLDCYVTGAPEPRVSWLHDGKQVETDSHHVLVENHTLLIPSAAMSDGGEYSCQADNGHSNASVSVHIIMDDIYVPESCTDNPRFANCNLILRARYCTHKHYSRFCCRSCMLAGQIHADGNE